MHSLTAEALVDTFAAPCGSLGPAGVFGAVLHRLDGPALQTPLLQAWFIDGVPARIENMAPGEAPLPCVVFRDDGTELVAPARQVWGRAPRPAPDWSEWRIRGSPVRTLLEALAEASLEVAHALTRTPPWTAKSGHVRECLRGIMSTTEAGCAEA